MDKNQETAMSGDGLKMVDTVLEKMLKDLELATEFFKHNEELFKSYPETIENHLVNAFCTNITVIQGLVEHGSMLLGTFIETWNKTGIYFNNQLEIYSNIQFNAPPLIKQENLIDLINLTVGYCQKAESSTQMEQHSFVELQRYISELKRMMFSISNDVRTIECLKREMKFGTETILVEIKQLQTFVTTFIRIWKEYRGQHVEIRIDIHHERRPKPHVPQDKCPQQPCISRERYLEILLTGRVSSTDTSCFRRINGQPPPQLDRECPRPCTSRERPQEIPSRRDPSCSRRIDCQPPPQLDRECPRPPPKAGPCTGRERPQEKPSRRDLSCSPRIDCQPPPQLDRECPRPPPRAGPCTGREHSPERHIPSTSSCPRINRQPSVDRECPRPPPTSGPCTSREGPQEKPVTRDTSCGTRARSQSPCNMLDELSPPLPPQPGLSRSPVDRMLYLQTYNYLTTIVSRFNQMSRKAIQELHTNQEQNKVLHETETAVPIKRPEEKDKAKKPEEKDKEKKPEGKEKKTKDKGKNPEGKDKEKSVYRDIYSQSEHSKSEDGLDKIV